MRTPPTASPARPTSGTRGALGAVVVGALLLAAAPAASAADRNLRTTTAPVSTTTVRVAPALAAYTAHDGRHPDGEGAHLPRDHHPVRHLVQRCGHRRGVQRDRVEQERHDREDAGVHEQARDGIQRADPLRARQALDHPGAAGGLLHAGGPGRVGRPEPEELVARRDGADHGHHAARQEASPRRGSTSTTTSSRRRAWPTGGSRATCPTRSPRCAPSCATSATTRTPAPRPAATSVTGSRPTA